MDISVVIPVFNSERTLEACLQRLREQKTSLSYEVITVDNSPHDRDEQIIKTFPEVVFIKETRYIFAGIARNLGVEKAKGEIIVFLDSDVMVEKNWLNTVFEYYRKGHDFFHCAIEMYTKAGWTLWEKIEWFYEFSEFKPKMKEKLLWCAPACGLVIKKDLLKDTKFENIHSSEDVDLTIRLRNNGNNLYFSPDVKVYHHHKISMKKVCKKIFGFGKSNIKLRKMHTVSGSSLVANKFILILVLPLFALVKFGKISWRNIRYNSFPDFLLFLALLPCIIYITITWMFGGYTEAFKGT